MLLKESDELRMNTGMGSLNLYVNVERSFMDIASGSINKDVTNVVAGFMIVFVYVALMLGKFDKVLTIFIFFIQFAARSKPKFQSKP